MQTLGLVARLPAKDERPWLKCLIRVEYWALDDWDSHDVQSIVLIGGDSSNQGAVQGKCQQRVSL